jgi:hypothetical protein
MIRKPIKMKWLLGWFRTLHFSLSKFFFNPITSSFPQKLNMPAWGQHVACV